MLHKTSIKILLDSVYYSLSAITGEGKKRISGEHSGHSYLCHVQCISFVQPGVSLCSIIKGVVQNVGKYLHSLSFREKEQKINTTLMSVH